MVFFWHLIKAFVPCSHGLTRLCVAFTEIASKQGHDDVSKLTPTDIAIESLHKIESFVIEHATDNAAGDTQAESQVQRIQTL